MLKKKNNIFFSGGGTGGPVTPLLAVIEKMMQTYPSYNYFLIGTKFGPEKKMLAAEKFEKECYYLSLPAGKWRRYFSINNFIDVFKIIYSFFYSFYYLIKYRPKIIISAGAYVSVPLVYAAYCFKTPIIIHQQDVLPGLANRLMAKVASEIGVSFEESLKYFNKKASLIGNPYRQELISKIKLRKNDYFQKWNFSKDKPILLVLGGASGSVYINQLIIKVWPVIKDSWQLVHISGYYNYQTVESSGDYKQFKFLSNPDLLSLISCSDLVISRAGLGTITELFALEKPAIIIPMPNTHQENNAQYLQEKEAAIVYNQNTLDENTLIESLFEFKKNPDLANNLSNNISQIMPKLAVDNLIKLISKYV